MKEAFTTLEKTLLFQLVYPTTDVTIPALPKLQLKPRLHALDTGLINYSTNMVKDILTAEDIADVYRGRIAEHITGQELLAMTNSIMNKLQFWVREKKQSSAEVDFLYPYNGKLIPIEVKSGSIGKPRSLHQFMDQAPHRTGTRQTRKLKLYLGGEGVGIRKGGKKIIFDRNHSGMGILTGLIGSSTFAFKTRQDESKKNAGGSPGHDGAPTIQWAECSGVLCPGIYSSGHLLLLAQASVAA
jgi:hypothetical protein